MRRVAYLAGAILALAGAGLAAIYLLSQPEAPPAGALPPPAIDPPAPPPVAAPAAPDLSRFGGQGAPPAPMVYAPAPPAPARDSFEAVPISRPRGLGVIGGSLRIGLEEVAPLVSACLRGAPSPAGRGASVSAAAGDEEVGEAGSGPALVLHVETLPGQLRVVDAPVLSWAGLGEETMACAQQALRGRTFAAPAAKPGHKLRVAYPLDF